MTKSEAEPVIAAVNELFSKGPDGLREIVRAVMQEMLGVEMTDALGAEKGERTMATLGYRSGYYTRTLVTRVGNSSCACRDALSCPKNDKDLIDMQTKWVNSPGEATDDGFLRRLRAPD
jgi:Transposase, Mutator family